MSVAEERPIRLRSFPIQDELGVEFAGSPTVEYRSHRRIVDSEKIRERLEVRSQGDNTADIQIPVGPAIQAMANARGKGVIHSRVTQAAGYAN